MKSTVHNTLIILLILFGVNLYGQNINRAQADSIYYVVTDSSLTNYRDLLKPALYAFHFFEETNDTCKTARLASRISSYWDNLGQLDSALQIALQTQPYSELCGEDVYVFNIISQTNVYLSLGSFEKTISVIDEALENDPNRFADSLMNDLLVNKAIALIYLDRTSEGKALFRSFYYHAVSLGNEKNQIQSLTNLGALYGMLEEYDSARYYLEIAIGICETNDCDSDLELLQNLATLAANSNDIELSISYLDSAISKAHQNGNLSSEVELYREIATATYNLGDWQTSCDYLFLHSNLKDSLINQQMIDAVSKYQEKFESEKKARKIQALELDRLDAELRENRLKQIRNLSLISGIAILILAIGLWNRLKYISKTKAVIEKEKERSDELLLNILPHEVAEELKLKGESEARAFDNVTVIFTDFKEFTETAEKLTAKELVDEINTCFKAFDQIIQDHNIEKIKTIGDAYMAAGGLNTPRNSEPIDVVKAAIDMQQFMIDRRKELESKGQASFEMRVGLHTGPVVAGIVGVKKFQYDIWGDTVNTASRMESYSESGMVNISDTTYHLIKNNSKFSFDERGEVEVKGKGKMKMWFVSRV